jgi:predicted membrane protein
MLFGLLIVGLGVAFMLNSLGIVGLGDFFATWWPSAIIIVGLLSLISSRRQFLWPLLIIAIGVLVQLDRLEVIAVNAWTIVWPLAIITFGLSLLINKGMWDSKTEDMDDDKLDLFVAFSGQQARSISKQFTGGRMNALFGGIEVDLTEAHLKDGKADLDLMAMFGGIELHVPEGWVVKVSGLPLFGGWENKTKPPKDPEGAPVLTVHGTCMFGGVSIKSGLKSD